MAELPKISSQTPSNQTEDKESRRPVPRPRLTPSIPPPPSIAPPICPVKTSVKEEKEDKEDDNKIDLKLDDIHIEVKTSVSPEDESEEEDEEENKEGKEYSYIRGRIRGSVRAREASLSPEPRDNEGSPVPKKDEDESSHYDSDPEYANLFPDIDDDKNDNYYMNYNDPVELREHKATNKDDVDKGVVTKRRSRPLSNYLNVAPLPEPMLQSKATVTSPSQPTSNTTSSSTEPQETEQKTEDSKPSHPRYKNLSKAPARPPEGFKKMPPLDNALITHLPEPAKKKYSSQESTEIETTRKIPPVAVPKKPLKKTVSGPQTGAAGAPRLIAPIKPPRSRNQHDEKSSSSSSSPSPTPPMIKKSDLPSSSLEVHKVSQGHQKSTSAGNILQSSSPSIKSVLAKGNQVPAGPFSKKAESPKESRTKPMEQGPPNIGPVKRAPPPPPVKQKSVEGHHFRKEQTPPLGKKIEVSPTTGRKVTPARTAPPPPPTVHSRENSMDELSKGISKMVSSEEKKMSPNPPIPPKGTNKKSDSSDPIEEQIQDKEKKRKHRKKEKLDVDKEEEGRTEIETLVAEGILNENAAQVLLEMKKTVTAVNEFTESIISESSTNDLCTTSETKLDKKEMCEGGALTRMDLLNVELVRGDNQGFGLHIAEGYAQTSKGLEVGVFVKDIVPGSPADKSGRLCESDMLVEIAGISMIGAMLEDAAKVLTNAGNSVRLKVGRTITSSRQSAEISSSSSKDDYDKLKEELTQVKKELHESKETTSYLTQAVATVTVDKTKLEMEVKSLKDKLATAQDSSKESSHSEIELEEVKSKLEEASKSKAHLTTELETMKEKLTSMELDLTSEQNKSVSLSGDIETLKEELKKEREEKAAIEKNNVSLSDEVTKLKGELEKEKREKELVIKGLSEKIIELESAVATSEEERQKVLSEKEALIKDKEHVIEERKMKEEKMSEEEVDHKSLDDKSIHEKSIVEEKEEKKDDSELHTEITVEEVAPAIEAKKEVVLEEAIPIIEIKKEDTPEADKSRITVKEEIVSKEVSPELDVKKEVENKKGELKEISGDVEEDTFSHIKSAGRLDSSMVLHRAQLSTNRLRKKPTRDHILSMVTLTPFPENLPELKVPEDENRKRISDPNVLSPRPQPSELPTPIPPRPKQEDLDKIHKQPQPAAPKPKPRPQPRKKLPSPEHASSPTPDTLSQSPPPPPTESPKPSKRPIPVPRTPSKEIVVNGTDTSIEAPSKVEDSIKASPKRSAKQSPLLPPKPSKSETDISWSPKIPKKPVPEPVRKQSREEGTDNSTNSPLLPIKKPKPIGPKPSPRSSLPQESDEDKLEALKRKDPSELTVKEKMMLAQEAMAKQAEHKAKGLPPPIRKKRPPSLPKSMSVDTDPEHMIEHEEPLPQTPEEEHEASMERSKSMEDLIDENTPRRQPKKLPPGAFNIAIPVGLPSDMRHRSYTVASAMTAEPTETTDGPGLYETAHGLEDFSSPLQQEHVEDTPVKLPSQNGSPSHSGTPQSTPLHEKISDIDISTPEFSRRNMALTGSADNLSIELSDDELDIDPTDMLHGSPSFSTAQPDVERVLYWSPEVVGMWLGNIGLGSSAVKFKESNIKGYMLFDLDNAKLKNLGIGSSDDRNVFKKEIKALKPYAEKLKKEHEKIKKEEKKRQELEKKQAKKKKK